MNNRIAKIFFMLEKFYRDITREKRIYEISSDLHSQQLGEYYFLFKEERLLQGKDQALIKTFDKNGIPINRTYIDVAEKGDIYFPISIGQVGLAVFHTFIKSHSKTDKHRFLNFVEWFYQHAQVDRDLGARWLTDVPLPQYRNPGPWQSAFAQSRGLSILLRGFQLTGKTAYAEMAQQALIPFTKAVSKGGVTSFSSWGPFYEEYTAAVPTLVLNGMIFSLFGLYDFCRVFPKNVQSRQLFDDGIRTVAKCLPQFDLGFWSRYNLCQAEWYPQVDPSTISYHNLHILQLEVLYSLTQNEVFSRYVNIFTRQATLFNSIRSLELKYKALKKIKRL